MTIQRFKIITLGCKVNQYESAYFNEALAAAGWRPVGRGDESDVVLVNTCIVTQKASHQSRQAIRKAIREHPAAYVAAVGCYAQVFPDELAQIDGLNLIADNRLKAEVPAFLIRNHNASETAFLQKPFEPNPPFAPMPIHRFADRTRAYLKIQDGCASYCSYCIVPFARGPCRSLPPKDVLAMLANLSGQGHKEVVLTGIHLGKYGLDLQGGIDLMSLLKGIGWEGLPLRIRLSSIEPNELQTGLIEMAASEAWLCRHFHIPLQSGDDRILKKMNRSYAARTFAERINAIHRAIPDAAIGVDIMVGFPGEGPGAHENSYALLNDLPVSYLHVFPYSPRTGTAASRFQARVDMQTTKKRAARLRTLGDRKRQLFYQRCLHKTFPVLAETKGPCGKNLVEGTSDNYLPVLFPSPPASEKGSVPVCMERIEGKKIIGRIA